LSHLLIMVLRFAENPLNRFLRTSSKTTFYKTHFQARLSDHHTLGGYIASIELTGKTFQNLAGLFGDISSLNYITKQHYSAQKLIMKTSGAKSSEVAQKRVGLECQRDSDEENQHSYC